MRRIAVAAALGLVVLAASVNAAISSPRSSSVARLAADRVLVSEAGHRISEFSVAANPRNPNHLVVAAMDWDDDRGSIGCATYVSRNGGLSWNPGGEVPGYEEAFVQLDPWVAFDAQGHVHLQCLSTISDLPPYAVGSVDGTTGRPSVVQMYSRSDDGGTTWSPATRVVGRHETNHPDKNALFASRAGTLYACYADFPKDGNDLVISRSLDGGQSWMPPVVLDDVIGLDKEGEYDGFGTCNGFAEGRNGEVHVLWKGYFDGRERYGTATTTDGGNSWRSTPIGDDLRYAETIVRAAPPKAWPSITFDPRTGEVFVTAQSWTGERYEAKLYRSGDAGVSYENVALPEITSNTCDGCHEMRPAAVVDRAGRLGIQVMLTSDHGLTKEPWFLVSPDRGATWLEPVQVSGTGPDKWWGDPRNWVPNDAEVVNAILDRPHNAAGVVGWQGVARAGAAGPAGHHVNYGGDYWSIAASAKGFVAFWEDNAQNGKHQLWARIIRVTRKSASPLSVPTTSSSPVIQQRVSEPSTSRSRGSACGAVSRATEMSVARLAPTVIAALAAESGSKLLSLTGAQDYSYGQLESRDTVLGAHRAYRNILQRRGFDFFFADYEGFEAELFGSNGESSILVRILKRCRGSSALVTLTR